MNFYFFNFQLGVIDSFRPSYSWEKRPDDSILMKIIRVVALIMVCGALYQFHVHDGYQQVYDFSKNVYEDIISWGIDKLSLPAGGQRFPSLESIKQETAHLADDVVDDQTHRMFDADVDGEL